MIRVLVVARSELERAGLEALLASRGHIPVGGGASLAEARRRLEDGSLQAVQVVLMLLERGADPPRLVLPPDTAADAPALVVLGESLPRGWAVRAARSGVRAVVSRTASADATKRIADLKNRIGERSSYVVRTTRIASASGSSVSKMNNAAIPSSNGSSSASAVRTKINAV